MSSKKKPNMFVVLGDAKIARVLAPLGFALAPLAKNGAAMRGMLARNDRTAAHDVMAAPRERAGWSCASEQRRLRWLERRRLEKRRVDAGLRKHVERAAKARAPRPEQDDTMIEHVMSLGRILQLLEHLGVGDPAVVLYNLGDRPRINAWPEGALTGWGRKRQLN